MPLQRLTGDALNRLYAEMTNDKGLAPRTVRYCHAIVRKALEGAVDGDLLARNAAAKAKPPKENRPEMATWTAQETARFLESVRDDRLVAAWVVAATTGLRRGELLGLRWRDIDFDTSRIAVVRRLVPVGKALDFSEPKSGKSRSVTLDAATPSALRTHRKAQAAERLAWGDAYQDGNMVFAHEDGTPFRPEWFTKRFGKLAKLAGVPPIRLHDLRHTHATLALAAGIHPKVVQERLGHSTVAFTLDRYSHAVPALEEEAAERVSGLIFGA